MKIKIKVSMMFLAAIISLSACGKGNTEDAFKEVKQERQKLSSSDTAKESKTNKANKDIEVSIKASRENIKLAKDDEEKKISDSQTTSSNGSHTFSSTKTVSSSYTANDSDANYETKTETVGEEKHEPKPVYVTKEIPEQGHWEKVVVKEAWAEEVPVYEQQYRMISNDTGEDWTDLTEDELGDAMAAQVEAGGKGSWSGKYIDVQVGTEKIYHEAETEEKWVVDVPAHAEEVLDHYE